MRRKEERREISGRGTELEAGSKERNGETEGEKEGRKGQRPRRNLLDRESRRCEMKPDGAHTLLVCRSFHVRRWFRNEEPLLRACPHLGPTPPGLCLAVCTTR